VGCISGVVVFTVTFFGVAVFAMLLLGAKADSCLNVVAVPLSLFAGITAVVIYANIFHRRKAYLLAKEQRMLAEKNTRLDEQKLRLEEQEFRKKEQWRLAAVRAIEERRANLEQRIHGLQKDWALLAGNLSKLVGKADRGLDLAENEFNEGVFAPFWDAIQAVANDLATFNRDVQQLIDYREKHKQALTELGGSEPDFELTLDLLPDATHTLQRMRAVVRKAQKEPNFAKIYEMRQHNKLLVEGFSSLGNALENLASTIEGSIRSLESTVFENISELASDQRRASEEALSEAGRMREQARQVAEEDAARSKARDIARTKEERKQRELLRKIAEQTKPPK
jgi:hypothetical protein